MIAHGLRGRSVHSVWSVVRAPAYPRHAYDGRTVGQDEVVACAVHVLLRWRRSVCRAPVTLSANSRFCSAAAWCR
ncbi:hypothetical protein KCP69_11300 [Salmonella enterica subsp. enterica]|nr:hypothetical protein KCP69_11300 [Salmonella enterica subsp. enterica]